MRRGKCPRARPDRITSFGIAHAGHPSSHALPSSRGLELIYAAHPEATQVAGGRCRVRAQLGRPRHARLVRGASQPHLQRGPRGGLVQPEEAACTHAARVSTPVSARGRGERVGGTARERAVACGASAHASAVRCGLGCRAWRVGAASGRPSPCLPGSRQQLAPPGGNSADDAAMATMANMATPS